MKAMILAAGRGERLLPLTQHTPKPMLRIQGKPLIEHQVNKLVNAGFTELVINLHHLGDQIADHLQNGIQLGADIVYSKEEQLLDTGGGMVKALPLLGDETFLIYNADIYTDFPLANLPDELTSGSMAHLVLTPTPVYREHGDFEFEAGRVTARGDGYVYCGIAVCSPQLFSGREARPFSWMDLVFAELNRNTISGQIYQGPWTDIGTIEQYESLNS